MRCSVLLLVAVVCAGIASLVTGASVGAFASTDCTGVLSYTRYDIAANGACYSSGGGQSLQIVCGVAPNRNIAVKTWTTSENCEGNPSFTGNRAEESQACIQLNDNGGSLRVDCNGAAQLAASSLLMGLLALFASRAAQL